MRGPPPARAVVPLGRTNGWGRPAPGLSLVRYAAALGTERPWFAIGGIDTSNLDQVLEAGARRIVVVRAITAADDPAGATAELAKRWRSVAGHRIDAPSPHARDAKRTAPMATAVPVPPAYPRTRTDPRATSPP